VLALEPAARARLAAFARADAAIRHDYPLRHARMHDLLAQQIMSAGAPAARRRFPISAAATALAACFAGFIAGRGLDNDAPSGPTQQGFAARGALAAMLETQPSNAPDSGVVTSFRARNGRFCREFQVGGPEALNAGVACRSAGDWRVVAWTSAPAPQAYRPAGAEQLLDAVVDDLGGEDMLTDEEETALIRSRWAAS
jgi:hypothetical protein